jgi:hypothetical protein
MTDKNKEWVTTPGRLISDPLVELVIARLIEQAPWVRDCLTYELQDDFQFLLITIKTGSASTEVERKQLGHLVDILMPARERDLSWMLNFSSQGKVVDSYFGGDKSSPGIGF